MDKIAIILACLIPIDDRCQIAATYVHTVEQNSYGPVGDIRTVYIFREASGQIIDWRWYDSVPVYGANPNSKVPQGWPAGHLMHWHEKGRDRIVRFKNFRKTRTLHDVELSERQGGTDERRRKLFTTKLRTK